MVRQDVTKVFPAYAGMFLGSTTHWRHQKRFPRVRGDVPAVSAPSSALTEFSPRTRGCSSLTDQLKPQDYVFPAYAGMFLSISRLAIVPFRFPRVRGDVPAKYRTGYECGRFSPRTRGCSFDRRFGGGYKLVFPAYAGMFLKGVRLRDKNRRFPRVRGDVPQSDSNFLPPRVFSPRTRGCSAAGYGGAVRYIVFPAYAGMFPLSSTTSAA